ncbi:MAG: hypothetical protein AAF196_05075 [Planctomycetota bacterium]
MRVFAHAPNAARRILESTAVLALVACAGSPDTTSSKASANDQAEEVLADSSVGTEVVRRNLDELVVLVEFVADPEPQNPELPSWKVGVTIRTPNGGVDTLRTSQPIDLSGPPSDKDDPIEPGENAAPEGAPPLEITRREFHGVAPFEVFEVPPSLPEDVAYAAVFGSDWNRSIVISPPWLAKPLAGYRRLAGNEDEPVVWARGFEGGFVERSEDEEYRTLRLSTKILDPSVEVVCEGLYPTPLTAMCANGGTFYWAHDQVLVITDQNGTPRSAGLAPGKVLSMAAGRNHLFALCRQSDTNQIYRWPLDVLDAAERVTEEELPGATSAIGLYTTPALPPIPGIEPDLSGPGVVALQAETLVGAARAGELGSSPLAALFAHGRLWATFTVGERRTVWIGEIDTDSTVVARVQRTSSDDLAPPAVGLVARPDGRFFWTHSEPFEQGFRGRMIEAIYDFSMGLKPRPQVVEESR